MTEQARRPSPRLSITVCVCTLAIRGSVYGKKQFLLYFRMTNSYGHYFCCFNTQANLYGQSLGR